MTISRAKFYGGARSYTGSSNITLVPGIERVWDITPEVDNLKVFLPDARELMCGGPHFYVVNSHGTNHILLRDAGDNAVRTVDPAYMSAVSLYDNTTENGKWFGTHTTHCTPTCGDSHDYFERTEDPLTDNGNWILYTQSGDDLATEKPGDTGTCYLYSGTPSPHDSESWAYRKLRVCSEDMEVITSWGGDVTGEGICTIRNFARLVNRREMADCYIGEIVFDFDNTTSGYYIYKRENGSDSLLGSTVEGAGMSWETGQGLVFRVYGNDLYMLYNSVEKLHVEDATGPRGCYAGFGLKTSSVKAGQYHRALTWLVQAYTP